MCLVTRFAFGLLAWSTMSLLVVAAGEAVIGDRRIITHTKGATVITANNATVPNFYSDVNVAQQDCSAWKDKAWPLATYLLYEDDNCSVGGHRFTKCAEYGDHWGAGRFICDGAQDMTFPGQKSMAIVGGREGLLTYILMDHKCPPPGNTGELGELDPGNGKCYHSGLENAQGVTVKNVDRGGNEITGHTNWIDTEWARKQGRRSLSKRQPKCSKFFQDDPNTRPGRTPSTPYGSGVGPCNQDKCHYATHKGDSVTMTLGGSVGIDTNMVFVTAHTEFHFDKSWQKSVEIDAEIDLGRGESAQLMCDQKADIVYGHWSECNDGKDHKGSFIKPADGADRCRYVPQA